MAGWGISATCCGWGKRLELGFVLPTVISRGGIHAPHVSSPLWSQPLSREFLCCSNLACTFGELLCSLEKRERFAAGSSQLLQAPWSTWECVPGWLTGWGCCWEQKELTAGSLLWGKSFHAEMSQLGLSGETDGSLQNSRGKHENIPPVYDNKLEMAKGKST